MASSLETSYLGLRLKNPFLAASAGTTKDAVRARRAEDAGFAGVVLKSVQEEEIHRNNPFPRFALLKNGLPGYNSHTLYSYEQAYEYGIAEYAEEVRRTKERLSIPVIASINCVQPDTWVRYAHCVEEAGADAIEVVPSCPIGVFLRYGRELENTAVEVTRRLKQEIKVPVAVKLSLQLTNPAALAQELEQVGADGVVLFNRLTGLEIDLKTMAPILHGGVAGHGGPWILQAHLRWVAEAARRLTIPISATGGVTRWEDAAKYILAGANSVQVCSAVYLKGYEVVRGMIAGLEGYLERHGIGRLDEIRGLAARRQRRLEEADRSLRRTAMVVAERCNGCRLCLPVCMYDALAMGADQTAQIDPERCDGCGLCLQVCPRGALVFRE
jgi:dihydroorotate dehydrogenase (fumarate)